MLNFNINEMNLYKTTGRFKKNYNYLIKKLNRKPTLPELSEFDHLHYNGTNAVDEAIIKSYIKKNNKVLDIGSGIGGPARYIADKTNAKIYAVELQKELNDIALLLTKEYNLNNRISHIHGDILSHKFSNIKFNNIVSWLAFYHIPNRTLLLRKLYKTLIKGGHLYTEDFFLKKKINNEHKDTLSKSFHANYLVNYEKYLEELKSNGFKILSHEDLSKNWTAFTKNRLESFKINIDKTLSIYDKDTVINLLDFYELAYSLLSNNILGGIRYICVK